MAKTKRMHVKKKAPKVAKKAIAKPAKKAAQPWWEKHDGHNFAFVGSYTAP